LPTIPSPRTLNDDASDRDPVIRPPSVLKQAPRIVTDRPTTGENASAEPDLIANLPKLISVGDVLAPEGPPNLRATGVDAGFLADLALKLAYTTGQFTTEWAVQQLRLALPLVAEILEQLRVEQMLETAGSAGPLGYRYSVSRRGRERAAELFAVSAYAGPAPVSLEAYAAMIEWQCANTPAVSPDRRVTERRVSVDCCTRCCEATSGFHTVSWSTMPSFGCSMQGAISLPTSRPRARGRSINAGCGFVGR